MYVQIMFVCDAKNEWMNEYRSAQWVLSIGLLHSHSDSNSLDKLCWVGEGATHPTNLSRQARRVTDDRRLILIVFIELNS